MATRKKTTRKSASDHDDETPQTPPLELIRLDACAERKIEWLWHNRIPLGKVTLLIGDPDAGKSFLALDLAARVSRGVGVPPEPGLKKPGNVLLLCADDAIDDTILPRLQAARADLGRIVLLPSFKPASKDEPDRLISLTTELQRFQEAVSNLTDLRLIVIDPITAYLRGAGADDHYTLRQLLQRLATIAREKNAAVLIISHLRKQASPTAVYRPLGSLAFAAVARVVLMLMSDPAVVGRRLLLPAKMSLLDEASGRAFAIEDGRVSWEPGILPLSADDLKAMVAEHDESGDQRLEAKNWLIDQLEKGRVPADDIRNRAHERKIPYRILRAAKKDAKVRSVYDGRERCWFWKLPDNWIRDFEGVLFPVVI